MASPQALCIWVEGGYARCNNTMPVARVQGQASAETTSARLSGRDI